MFSKQKGFTLIEFLVVIAIITIISAVMIVNFRKGEQSNRVTRNAQILIQGIRKTQNLAISSKEFFNGTFNEVPLGGYAIVVSRQSGSNTYYTIYADLDGQQDLDSGETVEKVNFESGVIVDYIKYIPPGNPVNTNIIFIPPDPTVTVFPFIPPADEIVITLQKQDGTACSNNCRDGITCSADKDCKAVRVVRLTGQISLVK